MSAESESRRHGPRRHDTYSHVIPDLKGEAAAKMDAILAGADPALVKQTEARVN